ncbi:amidase family protein [Peribacillus deserti]|uniref:Amidase n=1 Tax=Peribacillus deserti TaxID=673318 RepID=A0A2N5M6F5_9BACI|nr:amidase family protein [Peribacillus deserti]PLT29940.1 amidase [Peribacillus deserti]
MKSPKLQKLYEEWLVEATIDEMQGKMESGQLTSKELTLLYLQRIADYDKSGPEINSVLEINPDALQIAEALDAERAAKGPRGPLHGVPILVKDNIDTGDKMHTSAGSLALAGSSALEDSFVAAQLRKAGAVILGKTNMTEWANFMTENMPNGYSSRGGQVLNPYSPGKFDVGGSSAGSGASIAANLAAAAVGTETSGSILSPASQNSLVGIKPTVGLVSRTGIIPIAHSQDTAGPMARTVKDAVYLLTAISGVDPTDPATGKNTDLNGTDFTKFLDSAGLSGKRIGIAREVYFDYISEEKQEVLNSAIVKLKEAGAEVVEDVVIPSTNEDWGYEVLTYEFKADLNAYLSGLPTKSAVHSLADVIVFNNQNSSRTLKYGQTLLLESENTSGTLTESGYIHALEHDQYFSAIKGIDALLESEQLDAIVFPNNAGAGIPAKAGYPSITVPAGYTADGEPVGITFTGTAFSEPLLISIAYGYEQSALARKAPKLTVK